MAKNLKDIVDEGFTKLALLADKRLEILSRVEQITAAANGPEGELADQKLKAVEKNYVAEVNQRVEQMLDELKQSLQELGQNNDFLQKSTKDRLHSSLSKTLGELDHSRQYFLKLSTDKIDSFLKSMDKDLQSGQSELRSVASKQLAELDAVSKRNLASLRHSHAEAEHKIFQGRHDLSAELFDKFSKILKDAEKRRHKLAESFEKLHREHVEKIAAITDKLDDRALLNSMESLKRTGLAKEKILDITLDDELTTAVSDLKSTSQGALGELSSGWTDSEKELSTKLSELRELSSKLFNQELESLVGIEASIKNGAETICNELKRGPDSGKPNKIENAFQEISTELSELTEDLNRKVKDLLKSHSDSMASLCSAADKTFAELALDLNKQVADALKSQEQVCVDKEEALMQHLEKLEKLVSDAYSQFNAAGAGKTDGAGGNK